MPGSSPGSYKALIAQALAAEGEGRCADAIPFFEKAARLSERENKKADVARANNLLSGCQILLFRYTAALSSAERGHELAIEAHNELLQGAAAGNLTTIYSQLGDWEHAAARAEEAVACFQKVSNTDYLARALLNEADVESSHDLNRSLPLYRDAISAAQRSGNAQLEARAWDEFGTTLLLANKLADARKALDAAFSLETAKHDNDTLALTLEHRAELALRMGDYKAALEHIDLAFATPSQAFRVAPRYYPLHVRGQILEACGRDQEALSQYRKAVAAANQWRQGALPGDMSNTQTVVILHRVYTDFAQLAAELSLRSNNTQLAQEGFEAIAENRAASLREQITLALGQNMRLPPRYFELLGQLQAAQAQVTLGGGKTGNPAELQKIRLALDDVENEIGLGQRNIPEPGERNAYRNSLRDIQNRLTADELLLSFTLGERRSFLWAITKHQMQVCELKSAGEISKQAIAFAGAARQGAAGNGSAERLSASLFASIPPEMANKNEWLIAGDGPLLDSIPFADLPEPRTTGRRLIAAHSLRLLPSEVLLLSSPPKAPNPVFVGVGDPVYNLADSRRPPKLFPTGTRSNPASLALARLPGSSQEIRSAASVSGMPHSTVLLGPEATGDKLRLGLQDAPEIIHFAVHVVRPEGQPQQAALALSLNAENVPELLTSEVIAQYRVPGSLVVMSGCASEQGQSLPSAGLLGLSRAWLLAGAAAVVVTAWPTPDDSGGFFSTFYAHLSAIKTGTLSQRAASALQQSQLDMQRRGGYRGSPSFWAAYSIISKE